MLDITRLDEAITTAEFKAESIELSRCFNKELMVWILRELRAILFKEDGTRRSSFFIGKTRLVAFALKLGVKVTACLLAGSRPRDAGDIINH